MKKIIIGVVLILFALYNILLQRITVDAGEELVLIKKPWFYGTSGVEQKTYTIGTVWAIRSTKVQFVSLKPYLVSFKFSNVMTSDNIPISLNVDITFQNQKGKTAKLVTDFGEDSNWTNALLFPTLRVNLESYIKSNLFSTLQANSPEITAIENSLLKNIESFLKDKKIPIDVMQFAINKITPPKDIREIALNIALKDKKIKIRQKDIKLQELQQELERERAKADKSYMENMQMTISQYLKFKRMELEDKRLTTERYIIDHMNENNGTISLKMDLSNKM